MSNAVVTDWPSGSANQGWPQEPTGMLMPGRVQGWPAGTQRAANAAQRLLSQAVAWWDVEQYRDGDRFLRNQGTGGELLDLRLGSSLVANTNDPRYLAPEDQGYVYLPGVNGNFLSVPDEAALDVTGDIDIRVKVALDDWTPAAVSTLLGKWATSNRSYQFGVNSTGTLLFYYSTDGSTVLSKQSTVGTGVADGAVKWVRVTLDADNGGAGHDIKFWTSDDGSTWSQLGSTVTTAGVVALFSGSSVVMAGATSGGATTPAAGSFYRAIVKDGIDGPTVLDIDCDAISSGSATSFTASTGQTVTINRSTSGRKSVCVPSRHKGGRPLMLLATDDFLEVPVQNSFQHGLLDFAQGDSFTALIVNRLWDTRSSKPLLCKAAVVNATDNPGWLLWHSSAIYTTQLQGTLGYQGLGRALTASGTLTATIGRRDRAARRLFTIVNGGTSTAVDTFTELMTDQRLPFRVGNYSGTNIGADLEFYAAAVFRRSLSDREVALLSDYFTGRIA